MGSLLDTPPNGLRHSPTWRDGTEARWLYRFSSIGILLIALTVSFGILRVVTIYQQTQSETQEGIAQVEAQVLEGASTSQEVTRQLAALQCILLIEPPDRTVDNTNMCIDDAGIRSDDGGG